jgi:molecular chaperone DnaK
MRCDDISREFDDLVVGSDSLDMKRNLRRRLIDARNAADALVFNLEKQMREYDSKINDDLKKKINMKINDVKDLLKKDDATVDQLKRATEELGREAQEIGKLVYEEAQKTEAAKQQSSGQKGDVKEGEVVDEKK